MIRSWKFSTLWAALGLLALPACDAPVVTATLPPGYTPPRPEPAEEDKAEALGEMSAEERNTPPEKINLVIEPAPPTEPGKPNEMLNGLKYVTIKPGSGPAVQPGEKAVVHYVGTLEDGSVFDTSRKRNEPFTFTIGAGEVIEGWERGICGMHVGEIRKLTIPPDLAYKNVGKGPIPPHSTLIFEVELMDIQK